MDQLPDRAPDAEVLHPDVVRFLDERIDTVPHLEALLLLWESSDTPWRDADVAARLYVPVDEARRIVADLAQRQLVRIVAGENGTAVSYDSSWDPGGVRMKLVATAYRRQLVQVASLIHARAPTAVRDFARAFRFKKKE